MTRSAWWIFCDGLAVYRLAILVARDRILEPARAWLRPRSSRLSYLVTCDWCVSVWVAAGVVALTKFAPGVWQYPAFGLAIAAAAGFLSEHT